jgi:hypothetical protein
LAKLLAVSTRELALTWPAKKSVLELKAFGAAAGELTVGTRLTTWEPDINFEVQH